MKGFPERLSALIQREGLRGLSEKSGVAHTTLSSYEKGTPPGSDKITMIIESTGVSARWLIFGEGPMYMGEAGTPDKLLAPQKLQETVTDMLTVFNAVEHFHQHIWKKGKTYTPKQVASAVTLLCILGYMDLSRQHAADLAKLIDSMDV